MKTRIVDFDLEKAKAGAKVVTRDGRNVRILCYDVKGRMELPIIALVDFGEFEETVSLYINGRYNEKHNNDLDLFIEEPTFEDGDFIAFGINREFPTLGIFKNYRCWYLHDDHFDYPTISRPDYDNWTTDNMRLATNKEKKILLGALSEENKCWNFKKKCIETKTLIFKHFEKVLVRDSSNELWKADLFSHRTGDKDYPYQCCNQMWKQCIPFEGNEHLLGTIENLNL